MRNIKTLMKIRLGFFLIMLLVLIGLTFCVKKDLPPVLEKLPTTVTVVFPPVKPDPDSIPTTLPDLIYGSVADIDSNIYKTIQIGTQTWMAENLKTTRYNYGNPIPYVTDLIEWEQLIYWENINGCAQLTAGTYYWYNNDSLNKDIYGAIYSWYAVNNGHLCPTGWHVPTEADWTTLEHFLGGTQVAGGKLKETGTIHWLSPNTDATNESGFTALPGAVNDGPYGSDDWWIDVYDAGTYGLWWSADEDSFDFPNFACNRTILNLSTILYQGGTLKNCGASVRCLKD